MARPRRAAKAEADAAEKQEQKQAETKGRSKKDSGLQPARVTMTAIGYRNDPNEPRTMFADEGDVVELSADEYKRLSELGAVEKASASDLREFQKARDEAEADESPNPAATPEQAAAAERILAESAPIGEEQPERNESVDQPTGAEQAAEVLAHEQADAEVETGSQR